MPEYRLNDAGVLAAKIATPNPSDCPYTLFIGAGASKSSGIPTVQGMVREWQELVFRDQHDLELHIPIDEDIFRKWHDEEYVIWLNRLQNEQKTESEYSALFGYFYQQREERQMHIERLIEGKKPGFGYLYLAGLIQEKRFNRLLTTNFDDLLNDALTTYYDIKPIVCAFDSAVSSVRIASQRPKIIKLHGDFLYDNIKNVESELKRLDANMEEKLFEMCKDFGLIVVGYGANDESVMAPLREMVRKPEYLKLGLHWCLCLPDWKEDHIPAEELPVKLRDLIRYHEERVHLYAIQSFDELMEKMFVRCGCSLPEVLIKPHTNNLPNRFLETINYLRSGQELTSKMRQHMSEIIDSMEQHADTSEFKLSQAEIKWELGADARKRKDFEAAENYFFDGYSIIKDLLEREGLSVELLLRTLNRKAGLCIGLAKLAHQKNGNNWDTYIRQSIEATEQGVQKYHNEEITPERELLVSSLYYNNSCAYGILAKFGKGISKEEEARVKEHLSEFKMLDREGERLKKLLRDSDFDSLAYLLDDEHR